VDQGKVLFLRSFMSPVETRRRGMKNPPVCLYARNCIHAEEPARNGCMELASLLMHGKVMLDMVFAIHGVKAVTGSLLDQHYVI
jgi:hypothetical protein